MRSPFSFLILANRAWFVCVVAEYAAGLFSADNLSTAAALVEWEACILRHLHPLHMTALWAFYVSEVVLIHTLPSYFFRCFDEFLHRLVREPVVDAKPFLAGFQKPRLVEDFQVR